MVARSAFTQLGYSGWLLVLCTVLLDVLFFAPLAGMVWGDGRAMAWSVTAYTAMMVSYWPTLRYYGRNGEWALLLPVIASIYLAMTWTSALRYWRGVRSQWKNRVYAVKENVL